MGVDPRYVYLHLWLIFMVDVGNGKYTCPHRSVIGYQIIKHRTIERNVQAGGWNIQVTHWRQIGSNRMVSKKQKIGNIWNHNLDDHICLWRGNSENSQKEPTQSGWIVLLFNMGELNIWSIEDLKATHDEDWVVFKTAFQKEGRWEAPKHISLK